MTNDLRQQTINDLLQVKSDVEEAKRHVKKVKERYAPLIRRGKLAGLSMNDMAEVIDVSASTLANLQNLDKGKK